MKKERVSKGEKYWYISLVTGYGKNGISVDWDYDEYSMLENLKYAEGNYFVTQEEAESTARKLRAVLNGAAVETDRELEEARVNTFRPHLSRIVTEKIQSLINYKGSMLVLDEDDKPYKTYSMEDLFLELPHTVYLCNLQGKGVHAYIHMIDHYHGIITYETADRNLALTYTGIYHNNEGLMQALGAAICDIYGRRQRSGNDMMIMTDEEEKRLLNQNA